MTKEQILDTVFLETRAVWDDLSWATSMYGPENLITIRLRSQWIVLCHLCEKLSVFPY